MFGGQAVFCACLDLLFRLPRRVPLQASKGTKRLAPASGPSRFSAGVPSLHRCSRRHAATVLRGPRRLSRHPATRPLRNDSARPPDGAGLPPHHSEGKPHFVHARNPIRRADTAYGGIRPTGLHGNERRRLAVLLFLEFLSCLYGGERPAASQGAVAAFLSCLYGSEQIVLGGRSGLSFLSCLYGSEHRNRVRPAGLHFLSCLYGSEHYADPWRHPDEFLSCLYGSELHVPPVVRVSAFLSCLYGSERFDRQTTATHSFLSCLYGSELPPRCRAP